MIVGKWHSITPGVVSLPLGRLALCFSENRMAWRLEVLEHNEHLEGPSPEPKQKEPLQGPDGEAPAADPGIGAPGPLPDAGPQEGQVVEGVGSDAEEHLGEREAAFFEAIRDAIDDLHFAYSAVRAAGCGEGSLTLSNDTLQVGLVWGPDAEGDPDLRLSLSATLPNPEDDADRTS